MEIIKAVWIINFFFFGFILFFIWSKTVIIRKKVAAVTPIIKQIEAIQEKGKNPNSRQQSESAQEEEKEE
ncbi:MAG: hypothetical protein GF401_00350 [Chitinivibrionales bacterium]|nr:hypothetical protein [Chitinivibrionales bacterium]